MQQKHEPSAIIRALAILVMSLDSEDPAFDVAVSVVAKARAEYDAMQRELDELRAKGSQ